MYLTGSKRGEGPLRYLVSWVTEIGLSGRRKKYARACNGRVGSVVGVEVESLDEEVSEGYV